MNQCLYVDGADTFLGKAIARTIGSDALPTADFLIILPSYNQETWESEEARYFGCVANPF